MTNEKREFCTYIDHHGLLAQVSKGHGGVDSAPIKLDRATDAVDTAAEDNDAVVVESDIVGRRVVCSL
jgi:hypothetical protein